MSTRAGAPLALLAAAALAGQRVWAARDSFDLDGVLATEENESWPPTPRRSDPTNATGQASLLEDGASAQSCGPLQARQMCGPSRNFKASPSSRDFRVQEYGFDFTENSCLGLCGSTSVRCCDWTRQSGRCRGAAGGDVELRIASEGVKGALCEHAASPVQTQPDMDLAPSYYVVVDVNTKEGRSLGASFRTAGPDYPTVGGRTYTETLHYITSVFSKTSEGQTTVFEKQGLDLREGDVIEKVNEFPAAQYSHDRLRGVIERALRGSTPLRLTLKRDYEVAVVKVDMKKPDKLGAVLGRLDNGEHYIVEVFGESGGDRRTLWEKQGLDLRVGDIIQMVDQQGMGAISVKTKSHQEVVKIFADALGGSQQSTLSLYLKRRYHYVTVDVNTQHGGKLGATFQTIGGTVFRSVPWSIHRIVGQTIYDETTLWAHQWLDLRVGDVIGWVNGASVDHMSHDDFTAMIGKALRDPRAVLRLTILRGDDFGKRRK